MHCREVDEDSPFCIEMQGQSTTLYRSSKSRVDGPMARSSAKEFRFDHSYWSVDSRDEHFSGQEKVSSQTTLP